MAFKVDLKVKEKQGNYYIQVDCQKNLTPRNVILLMYTKYITKRDKIKKGVKKNFMFYYDKFGEAFEETGKALEIVLAIEPKKKKKKK